MQSPRFMRADDETAAELVAKCQENGWLMRGGYPWQDDPYLEEYPYEFAKAGMETGPSARASCTRTWRSYSRSTAATSGGR